MLGRATANIKDIKGTHQPFHGKHNIISTILTSHNMEQTHPREKINKDTFLSIFVSTADCGPNETVRPKSERKKRKSTNR